MTGCAMAPSAPPAPASPPPKVSVENQIEARVKAYWEARQQANLPRVYEFYSPDFKKKVSKEVFFRNYRRLFRYPLESIQVESIVVELIGQRASVRIKVTCNVILEGKTLVLSPEHEEVWVYMEDKWWKETEPILPNI